MSILFHFYYNMFVNATPEISVTGGCKCSPYFGQLQKNKGYSTRHGILAIPDEICRETRCSLYQQADAKVVYTDPELRSSPRFAIDEFSRLCFLSKPITPRPARGRGFRAKAVSALFPPADSVSRCRSAVSGQP